MAEVLQWAIVIVGTLGLALLVVSALWALVDAGRERRRHKRDWDDSYRRMNEHLGKTLQS